MLSNTMSRRSEKNIIYLPEDVTREIASFNNQQPIIDEQNFKIEELNRQIIEAQEATPAIFASVGELFTHDTYDRFGDFDIDIFEYEGRTPEQWLIFHHVEGAGFYWLNGGVRDAIGAWPLETYQVTLENGEVDEDRIKLPPRMCFMFRKYQESDDEEEESDDDL